MAELKTCVVCGAGSNRTDWINKLGDFVACDSHSRDVVSKAIAKAQALKGGTPTPATPKSVPIPPAAPKK